MQVRKKVKRWLALKNLIRGFFLTLLFVGLCDWSIVVKLVNYAHELFPLSLLDFFLTYNFPPDDYYKFLFEIPLRKGIQKTDFRIKYKARYEIYVTGFNLKNHQDVDLKVHVKVYDREGRVYVDGIHSKTRVGYLYDEEGSTIPKLTFAATYVSGDTPVDKLLTIEVEGLDGVDEFVKRFPEARVVMRVN